MKKKDFLFRMAQAFKNNLHEAIAEKIKQEKEVFIVGSNDNTKKIVEIIEKNGASVSGIITDGINCYKNFRTISFDELQEKQSKKILLLISENYVLLAKKLRNMGFENFLCFEYLEYWAENYFKACSIAKNIDLLTNVFVLLEDEASKESFTSHLEYRITGNPLCVKISNYSVYYHPFVRAEKGDIIYDGGAFDGDSATDFYNYLDGKCTIYAFEPEGDNYTKLEKNIKERLLNPQVIPVPYALWSDEGNLLFDSKNIWSSRLIIKGDYRFNYMQHKIITEDTDFAEWATQVNVIDIDKFTLRTNTKVDMIKLDVEGAELPVLQGAVQTLARYRPKLQISGYHNYDDLWTIPLFIANLELGYKLYFSHHMFANGSWSMNDAIFYALPK